MNAPANTAPAACMMSLAHIASEREKGDEEDLCTLQIPHVLLVRLLLLMHY